MKWNTHVKKTAAKGNQMLGVLRRNLKNCPRNLKDLAYKSILRPKLEYASSVWHPYTAENINKLEGVQRRSARFVCNKYSRKESVTSMLDDLEWPPLQQRRAESRLALFHRIVNGTVDRLAPICQQSGTLLFCSCHGIAGFLVDELQI